MNHTVTLNNGVKMPLLGLGSFASVKEEAVTAIHAAADSGYRMFDTAQMYGNEAEIGEALKDTGLARDEIFITSKVFDISRSYALTKEAVDVSLKNLQTDYLDLMLIHMPYEESLEMYQALEDAYQEGKIRAIGVANFTAARYLEFIRQVRIIPAINQFETHVFKQNGALQKVMEEHGTCLSAWSPLAKGRNGVFQLPVLTEIAEKHKKTTAQIMLRNLVQRGIPVIPKSVNPERIAANAALFDFALDDQDMARIAALDRDETILEWTKNL